MTVRRCRTWLLVGCASALLAGCGERGDAAVVIAPPRFVPYEIGFWSAARGIALNRSGRWMATTSDGGAKWRILRRWDGPVGSLSVASGGAVAVLGDCRRSVCRRMWRSQDDGMSWQGRVLPSPVSTLMLARSSPQTAWSRTGAYGTPRSVQKVTYDGGRHWVAIRLPCPNGWDDSSPSSLATPDVGWMVCTSEPSAGSQPKQLYRTADGGARWTRLIDIHFRGSRPPVAGGLSGLGYPSALSMTADGHGLLAMDRAFSYRTSDGGRHWRPLRSITSPDTRDGFAVDQLSSDTALMLVWSGDTGTTLYRTTDGGLHWSIVRRFSP